ncbi:glycoside hydrolase family 3 C-terminal domain-containing protein [Pseudomonas gingeri]|jgi:beta-glucosidase|uniref:beta-glucosidase n=1 Tax=Pseudomonas gingeri TaxID=117681 RepID=A0A7Y7WA04_9PSED|nr:glycoside hydrolase family 3 C-terminal domain-containing protein [Pseudomonas gingeri]
MGLLRRILVTHLVAALLATATLETCVSVHADSLTDKAQQIEQLLARMTLEEKAGQLTQLIVQKSPSGPVVANGGEDVIRHSGVGSLLGAAGVRDTRHLQQIAVEESRLHIPLLFTTDVIHGFRTIFPVPLAEASAWDPDLTQRTTRAAAVEASASGVHLTYAPMVDITRDPRWGRVVEGAGEDPFLGSALAVARVRGFHGQGAPDVSTLLTTAKHFVGYGAPEGGRDYNTSDLSERTLLETYLPPFRAAVQAGVDAVMPAYNELDGVPMHANDPLLKEKLREQWGFRGLIISDFGSVRELMQHGVAATPTEAVKLAFGATVDIDMVSGLYAQELPELVRSGQLSQNALDAAVRRVLEAKQRLGLFDAPYRYSDAAREKTNLLTPQSRALAREAAQKSMVLLKNNGALLPLHKDLPKLLVVGALADDQLSTLGSWSGDGRAEEAISVLQGIKGAVSSATQVVYIPGASPDDLDLSEVDKAHQAALDADVVVAVLGERANMSGEAHSRSSLGLPGAQDALLARLVETGKPLVVILMNGRPLTIPRMAEQVPAILESWFLGSEMGNAVADVLFGDVNPSGKLPITFPRSAGQVPLYYNQKNTGQPSKKDEAYIDLSGTPLYPFGHGLSYTTFTYDPPILSATQLAATDTLKVQVTVHNTGQREGEEIVQLYLHDNVASVTRPVRLLRGFTRVRLAPGEARTVSFLLDQDDFAFLDQYFLRRVEPGTFTVFVGGSSATDNQASFEITNTARVKGLGSAIPRMLRTPENPPYE